MEGKQLTRNDILREVQIENFKSLKKLNEVSKKYGFQFWVAYGTLLGTIRHKGFIPWDDDLDVCMLREDYEKLLQVPDEEWGEDFLLCNGYSEDIRHDQIFSRLYLKQSMVQSYHDLEFWRDPETHEAWHTSMMCDIYVFDHISDDDKECDRLYQLGLDTDAQYRVLKLETNIRKNTIRTYLRTMKGRFVGRNARRGGKKPWKDIVTHLDQEIASSKPGKRIGTYYTTDPYRYDYDDVFPLTTAEFEGIEVPIPKNYDQMLKDMYGDYMAFPPENDRIHINMVYMKLDGKEYVIDPVPGSLGYKK